MRITGVVGRLESVFAAKKGWSALPGGVPGKADRRLCHSVSSLVDGWGFQSGHCCPMFIAVLWLSSTASCSSLVRRLQNSRCRQVKQVTSRSSMYRSRLLSNSATHRGQYRVPPSVRVQPCSPRSSRLHEAHRAVRSSLFMAPRRATLPGSAGQKVCCGAADWISPMSSSMKFSMSLRRYSVGYSSPVVMQRLHAPAVCWWMHVLQCLPSYGLGVCSCVAAGL